MMLPCGFGVLRQSRSFRAATASDVKGHYHIVWWRGNTLFSETLRGVALRVWSAAAKPQLSCSDGVWRKGPLPQCAVAREHVVQRDAA